MVIVPETGSMVLITSIDGRCWFVSQCSKVEKITIDAIDNPDGIVINGGNNYGLIKIEKLTQKLNELVRAFNHHTHTGTFSGTIGGSDATGSIETITVIPFASNFDKSYYEDTKVTH